jgi:hypothetical protein
MTKLILLGLVVFAATYFIIVYKLTENKNNDE